MTTLPNLFKVLRHIVFDWIGTMIKSEIDCDFYLEGTYNKISLDHGF